MTETLAEQHTDPAADEEHDNSESSGQNPLDPLFEGLSVLGKRMSSIEELIGDWPPGGKWFLPALNAKDTAKLLSDVSFFTAWLNKTISRHLPSDVRILPCWYRHEAVVEMLIAVMVAHQSAYAKKVTKPTFQLSGFFTQSLLPMLEKIKQYKLFHGCTIREHKVRDEFTTGPVWLPDAPEMVAWINARAEAAHRRHPATEEGAVFIPVRKIHSELYYTAKPVIVAAIEAAAPPEGQ